MLKLVIATILIITYLCCSSSLFVTLSQINSLKEILQNSPPQFDSPPIIPSSPSDPTLFSSYYDNDPIKNYDLRKYYDPLVNPTKRVPRHEINPMILRQMVDLPTRGYPDNYTQLGILIKEGEHTKQNEFNENKIIRLYGRQEYPGSTRYEYYTGINSGNDIIKIPLGTKKELYDGDHIFVNELKDSYRIKLYPYDAPKYYPDVY